MHGVSLDINSIEKLLVDFNRVTGIRVAFVSYDLKTWMEVPKEKALFCHVLRQDDNAALNCLQCDSNAFRIAESTGELYIYQCHAGLTEAVAPIVFEDKLLGYLMMGQTLYKNPDKDMWEKNNVAFSKYKINIWELEKAFYKLTTISHEVIYSAARIMDMSAKYIHLTKLVKLKEPQLMEKIKDFLEANLDRKITIVDLSKYLNLSGSYLSHIIKSSFKQSFTEYLMRRRLEEAKKLLEANELKISEIAFQVGFQDQNYFSRVFKECFTISPSEYRINIKK